MAHDCTNKPFQLVFWQNTDEGFHFELEEYITKFKTYGWEFIDLDVVGPLALKSRLTNEPNTQFVLFQNGEPPAEQKDPLLDLRLAYPVFIADQWSIFLDEMGLGSRPDLLDYLKEKGAFFTVDAYRIGITRYGLDPKSENSDTLDLKALATLAGADEASVTSILMALFTGSTPDKDVSRNLEKYGFAGIFWKYVRDNFGYNDMDPGLAKMLLKLMVSDLSTTVSIPLEGLSVYILPNPGASFRFCQQWRNSVSGRDAYIRWSTWVQDSLSAKIQTVLSKCALELLCSIQTFNVEHYILEELVKRLKNDPSPVIRKTVGDIAEVRKRSEFWLDEAHASSNKLAYAACVYIADFFNNLELFRPEGIVESSAFLEAYARDWFKIDQSYRLYIESVKALPSWELFKDITHQIEDVYCDKYLVRLGICWNNLLSGGEGSLAGWLFPGVEYQKDMYRKKIQPYLETGTSRRAYVIVSDALRFEVGEEIARSFGQNKKLKTALSWMLTSLPSITRIGMAEVLPHVRVSLPDAESVLIDGKSSQGLEARRKILEAWKGIAIDSRELLGMKREAARAFQKDASVVYIFHDSIDATGDKAASEENTFESCRTACDDIQKIVTFICNTLSGSHILVTADHGFIFTSDNPGNEQKSSLPQEIPGATDSKKRYILGTHLGEYAGAIRGDCSECGLDESPMQFLVPLGIQIFHRKGGARFFHGGCMPQEVVVPLIIIKPEQDGSRNDIGVQSVGVGVIGVSPVITSRLVNFKVFQEEAISENVLARTLTAGLYFGSDLVTDSPVILLNSTGNDSKTLTKQIQLHLLGDHFDSKADYRLALYDADTGVEVFEQNVRISLMIMDEF